MGAVWCRGAAWPGEEVCGREEGLQFRKTDQSREREWCMVQGDRVLERDMKSVWYGSGRQTSQRCKDFYLTAKARVWPCLSNMCHIRSTAAGSQTRFREIEGDRPGAEAQGDRGRQTSQRRQRTCPAAPPRPTTAIRVSGLASRPYIDTCNVSHIYICICIYLYIYIYIYIYV